VVVEEFNRIYDQNDVDEFKTIYDQNYLDEFNIIIKEEIQETNLD
jgi:hypothetical protein